MPAGWTGNTPVAGPGPVTFTGTASVAEYEALLATVTVSASSAGIRTVSFTVTDAEGNESVLPAAVTVTTVAAPQVLVAPVVLAAPVAVSIAGDAVTVSPVVVITDVDSSGSVGRRRSRSAGVIPVMCWGGRCRRAGRATPRRRGRGR